MRHPTYLYIYPRPDKLLDAIAILINERVPFRYSAKRRYIDVLHRRRSVIVTLEKQMALLSIRTKRVENDY